MRASGAVGAGLLFVVIAACVAPEEGAGSPTTSTTKPVPVPKGFELVASLPQAMCCQGAAWGPGVFLVAGGQSADGSPTDALLTFKPGESAVASLGKLPSARYGSAVVWTGTHFLVFGGRTANAATKEILKVDPTTGAVTKFGASLPGAWTFTTAVWDHRDLPFLACRGGCAYVFGGVNEGASSTSFATAIFRFSPAEPDNSKVLSSTLPAGRSGVAAFFDDEMIYILGGRGADGPVDDILRLDPQADTIEAVGKLSVARQDATVLWDDRSAFLVGGTTRDEPQTAGILRFDRATLRAEPYGLSLPSPRSRAAGGMGGHGYVFGGDVAEGKSADVLRIEWGVP
ncbi:MAG: hypothetical protein HYT80_04640 [Euryarchaeota archaeon]|nr:hypothetical protein [Euryarchaeota archaeon]